MKTWTSTGSQKSRLMNKSFVMNSGIEFGDLFTLFSENSICLTEGDLHETMNTRTTASSTTARRQIPQHHVEPKLLYHREGTDDSEGLDVAAISKSHKEPLSYQGHASNVDKSSLKTLCPSSQERNKDAYTEHTVDIECHSSYANNSYAVEVYDKVSLPHSDKSPIVEVHLSSDLRFDSRNADKDGITRSDFTATSDAQDSVEVMKSSTTDSSTTLADTDSGRSGDNSESMPSSIGRFSVKRENALCSEISQSSAEMMKSSTTDSSTTLTETDSGKTGDNSENMLPYSVCRSSTNSENMPSSENSKEPAKVMKFSKTTDVSMTRVDTGSGRSSSNNSESMLSSSVGESSANAGNKRPSKKSSESGKSSRNSSYDKERRDRRLEELHKLGTQTLLLKRTLCYIQAIEESKRQIKFDISLNEKREKNKLLSPRRSSAAGAERLYALSLSKQVAGKKRLEKMRKSRGERQRRETFDCVVAFKSDSQSLRRNSYVSGTAKATVRHKNAKAISAIDKSGQTEVDTHANPLFVRSGSSSAAIHGRALSNCNNRRRRVYETDDETECSMMTNATSRSLYKYSLSKKQEEYGKRKKI